ncbi:uncharacterized protein JCM10292_003895 [Rhodotorula paludigena]|uniref:uncharacterized protein n=1 Tax=Rhodotorula paludigena TaxID=86838 RepID=UPI00316FD8FF
MSAEQSEAVVLDTLQSLFPAHSRTSLSRYLVASSGNVERAFRAIEQGRDIVSTVEPPKKRARTRGTAGGLAAWVKPPPKGNDEVLVLSDSDDDGADSLPQATAGAARPATATSRSAFDVLRAPSTAAEPSAPASTHVNLPPLTLSSPELVARHTDGLVTLVENALPVELASRLYVKMVRENEGKGEGDQPWQQNKWYLVDREVTSPHTSCFYRELPAKLDSASGYDAAGFDEYWYNGVKRTARPFTADQDEARQLVGEFVRVLLKDRDKHELEWDGPWQPNVAVANCYKGSKESVGFHSDVLQYLGPYPTIASLTLGCARPFRLRPFIPSGSVPSGSAAPKIRTLDIILPHNSLLIMHAGVQERYKHAVPPVNGMDVFKLPRGSLQAGPAFSPNEIEELESSRFRERINMTFRHYRPDFAPRTSVSAPNYQGTPLCACGVPCTLRPDGRGRARASLGKEGDEMLFFWVCNAGASNEGKGCGTWRVLDMRKEARGKWFVWAKSGEDHATEEADNGGAEGAAPVG